MAQVQLTKYMCKLEKHVYALPMIFHHNIRIHQANQIQQAKTIHFHALLHWIFTVGIRLPAATSNSIVQTWQKFLSVLFGASRCSVGVLCCTVIRMLFFFILWIKKLLFPRTQLKFTTVVYVFARCFGSVSNLRDTNPFSNCLHNNNTIHFGEIINSLLNPFNIRVCGNF